MSNHLFDEVRAEAIRSSPGKPLDLMRIMLLQGEQETTITCSLDAAFTLAEAIARCGERADAENQSRGGGLPS